MILLQTEIMSFWGKKWLHRIETTDTPETTIHFFSTIYYMFFPDFTIKAIFELLCMKMDTFTSSIKGSISLLIIQINVKNVEQGHQHRELKGLLKATGVTRLRHKTSSNKKLLACLTEQKLPMGL